MRAVAFVLVGLGLALAALSTYITWNVADRLIGFDGTQSDFWILDFITVDGGLMQIKWLQAVTGWGLGLAVFCLLFILAKNYTNHRNSPYT